MDNSSFEGGERSSNPEHQIETSFSVSSSPASNIEEHQAKRCCSEKTEKIVIGCVVVVLLAVSWVGTNQYAQSAVQLASFDAPYFTVWFGTCWVTLCFPGYCAFAAIKERNTSKFIEAMRDSGRVFGTPRITVKAFFIKILPMNLIWLATNYLYIFGLKFIAATDAAAIFASNIAFVYVLSLFILREKLYIIKVLSCITCISGVVLFAYAQGFAGGSKLLAGVLMATASAFGAAIYKVIFKKMVGSATLGQVSLFLTLLGVCNALFMWSIFVILYFTGAEYFSPDDIPWSALNASNALGLVFNFSINFGVAYTYPLFISVAMLLGIPLNAVVDIIVRDVTFSGIRVGAGVLIVFGFCIMLLPDKWNNPIHSLFMCKNGEDSTSPNEENPENERQN